MFLHLIRGMTLCYENTTFGTFMQDREDVAGFYGVYTNETYFWMTETINAFQFSQVFIGGVHGDLCETFVVGSTDKEGQRLVDTCKQCLDAAVSICSPGTRYSWIGNTIR